MKGKLIDILKITNVNYIWRITPSLVTLKKIKKSSKGRYSGLFHYSRAEGITEEHEKWEKLSRDNAEYITREEERKPYADIANIV